MTSPYSVNLLLTLIVETEQLQSQLLLLLAPPAPQLTQVRIKTSGSIYRNIINK